VRSGQVGNGKGQGMQGENDFVRRSLFALPFLPTFGGCLRGLRTARLFPRRLYTSFTLSTLPQRAAAWYG
jgi:hypothetical protein